MKQIRKAKPNDIGRIAEIHAEAWHHAYSSLISPQILSTITPESRKANWTQAFATTDQEIFVCADNEDIAGFIRLALPEDRLDPPADYGELTHLYLDPQRISTGLGHELFEFARLKLREHGHKGMLLWTLEGNTRARSFYEAHGMTFDGTRDSQPSWLGDGVFEVRYVYEYDA